MNPLYEYQSYRKYILDYYQNRKKSVGFTWREFAGLAGFSNPVYLKQVSDGKFKLSPAAVERVARAMNLAGTDLIYFRMMVAFDHAKSPNIQHKAYEKMQAIAGKARRTPLKEDALNFFRDWRHSVIREIVDSIPHATPKEIAELCHPRISAEAVQESLDLMVRLGILFEDNAGAYHQTSKVISLIEHDKKLAAKALQRQMGEFALKSLERTPMPERNMSGLTIGISKIAYERLVYELAEFRKKVISIVTNDQETEQIYRMNFQFFPLTKKLPKRK